MDEFKIGDDIEETPGTSRLRKENNIIPIIIVVIVAIAIGLGVFFISNSILNPKKKEVKEDVITTTLDTKDENVQILYNYVTYGINNIRNDKFIKEQNTSIDSFTNYEKFYYALLFAEADDFEETGRTDSQGNKIYNISDAKVKNYMERFFGPNIDYSTTSEVTYTFNFSMNGKNIGTMKHNDSLSGFDTVFTKTSVREQQNYIKPFYTKLSSASSKSDGTLEINEKIIYTDTKEENGLYTINIYKDYQHTMLIDSKTNITKEKLPTTEISIDEYLSNASTITYKFNSANQTYYFESSTISNS